MAVLFGLLAAASYGAGDFFGGLASKKAASQTVVVLSQLAGLVLAVILALAFAAARVTGRDLLLGVGVGIAGLVGLSLLYRGLAVGRMSVIAPITAVGSATLPVLWGLASGEHPSPTALAGVVVALLAVVLVARAPHGHDAGPADPRVELGLAAGAGVAFGIGLALFGETSSGAGLWPLVTARVASVVILGGGALLAGRLPRPSRETMPSIVLAGSLDMGANAFYLAGVHTGLVSLVAVLTALYPASTVVLARVVLDERLSRHQVLGLVLAAAGAALIAAG